MQIRPVKTDAHLRELVDYKDVFFPVETWRDTFADFIDHTVNCHWHSAFEFGTVLEGRVDFYTDETCLKLETGDCIFVNSNVLHMAKQTNPQENAVIIGVGFPPSVFPGGGVFQTYFHPIIQMPLQGFRLAASDPYGIRFSRKIHEICSLQSEAYGYELQCLSLISGLWLDTLDYISKENPSLVLKEGSHGHGDVIKKMISYIQEHFADHIAIADLTEHAHVSRSECFRCFHRYTGKKPMEYINEYRLSQAASLLKGTNLPVSEISSSCGFGSSSYFGKLFKETYRLSPLEYRKM